MDKSKLKKFATSIRIELMQLVSAKLEFLLNLDIDNLPIQYKSSQLHIKTIINRTQTQEQKEDFIEEVSYTWFNRLVALRFMDANNITDTLVVTPLQEGANPAIFTDAKEGTISDDLNIDRQKFFDLIDGKINSSNPENEAYSMLFISVCNYYSSIMPLQFESIADYTELLLPDDLLSSNSVRAKVVDAMSEEECKDIEIIGWLYQFYIAEKKDDVFAALKKNKKITPSNIPAATQLFTPHWIVKYMVENSLGKLWMLNNPNSTLKEHMKYYIENEEEKTKEDSDLSSDSSSSTTFLKISSPQELTLLDPCCGSGHVLTYAFDLLTLIYEECGYSSSEIPSLILENNLFGCDIDKRAALLADFALTMKARLYHRRFFRKNTNTNIIELQDFSSEEFRGIKNFGSLKVPVSDNTFGDGVFGQNNAEFDLQKEILTNEFTCVVTNPPYMGAKGMNKELSDFVKSRYPDSKSDLFAVFMERGLELVKGNGYMAMITMQSWMFLSSYEKLRIKLLKNHSITSLLQIGANSFPELNSQVAMATSFIIQKEVKDNIGLFLDLDVLDRGDKEKVFFRKKEELDFHFSSSSNFKVIPGFPIAYWISNRVKKIFTNSILLKSIAEPRQGMATSDNDRFLKIWYEVNINKAGFNFKNKEDAKYSLFKWFPYNKGGDFRKWYGNQEYLINWENDGYEVMEYASSLYGTPTRTIKNISYYFKESISWSFIGTNNFGVRYSPNGFLFDIGGSSLFPDNVNIMYFTSFLCSKVTTLFLKIFSPTVNFQAGDLKLLPIIYPNKKEIKERVEYLTKQNIEISKQDWDNKEISWDFTKNELLKHKSNSKIETAYENYYNYWSEKFETLHKNEEELNRLFIDIYELQDELTPEVELKDITILKQESKINDNNELEFNAGEIIKQFISYAVGVMFGRYSLDEDGLVVANLNQNYPKDTTFEIDDDNIIPVLEDDFFTDDIASRFTNFVKVVFGEESLSENIDFIEKSLGTTIRKYFVKGFYEDHIKRYKKRPIYWMVSSPKKGFNTLIYMHRYRSDIFATIQNDYLREYITKLESNIENLQRIADDESNSNSERNKASKEITKSNKILDEIIQFDRTALTRFAQDGIDIDLDDGVKVNYCKFKDVLYPITGLSKK